MNFLSISNKPSGFLIGAPVVVTDSTGAPVVVTDSTGAPVVVTDSTGEILITGFVVNLLLYNFGIKTIITTIARIIISKLFLFNLTGLSLFTTESVVVTALFIVLFML